MTKFLVLLVALLAGCQTVSHRKLDPYGLILVEITMDHEALADLNSKVFAKTPLPGAVKIDGHTFRAKINYAGKSTIDDFKKSFDFEFQDGTYKGAKTYRASAQSLDKSGLRSLVGFKVFDQLGVLAPDIAPASLYLNGVFQGLYFLVEPIDKAFFKARKAGYASLFKATYGNASFGPDSLAHLANGFSVKSEPEVTTDLERLIQAVNLEDSAESKRRLETMLDIDQYFHYVAANVILHNWDGFRNNFFLYRSDADDEFRIVPWDLDRIFAEDPTEAPFAPNRSVWGDNELTKRLLTFPEQRRRYLEILGEALTKFSNEAMDRLLDERAQKIKAAFAKDRVLTSGGKSFDERLDSLRKAIHEWLDQIRADYERVKQQ